MIRAITLSALLAGLFVPSAGAATLQFGGTRVQVSLPNGCRALSCLSLSLAQASRPRLGKERRSALRGAVETRARRTALPQALGATALAATAVPPRAMTVVPTPTNTEAPELMRPPIPVPMPRIEAPPTQISPQTVAPMPTRLATPARVAPRASAEAHTPTEPVPHRDAANVPKPATFAGPKSSPPEPPRADDVSSPVGYWLTEKHEGRVHIVECGAKLCGYAFDARKGIDGEQVLIGMKPVNGTTWRGRIHDTRGYGTYDSTIVLKGSAALRVQGCAFGGFFCGGQTWTRL